MSDSNIRTIKNLINNKEFEYIKKRISDYNLKNEKSNLVIFGSGDKTYVFGFAIGEFEHWEGLDFNKISPLEIKDYFKNLQILKDIGLKILKDGKIDSETISEDFLNLEYDVNENIEKDFFNILLDNQVVCRGIILEY